MGRIPRIFASLGLAGLLIGVTACGTGDVKVASTNATLSGTVKYGTDQVMYGMVIVRGGPTETQGKIGENGEYQVGNCPLGECLIGINTESGKGEYMAKTMGERYAGPQGKGGAGKASQKFVDVPAKYRDAMKSGLKFDVKAGANRYDIVIPK
jgi:hypothetical protein